MAFEHQPSAPGHGYVESRPLASTRSQATSLYSRSPLKLVSPASAKHERAVLVFALNHGGGLVAGDQIQVDIDVRDGSRLGFLTQGSTKIYKQSGSARSLQVLNARVGSSAALLVLPDPIQPFRDSVGAQHQRFEIHPTESNLVVLDWITEGRTARGEKWSFAEWESRNEVWSYTALSEKRLLLRDAVRLKEPRDVGGQPISACVANLGVFGIVVIKGMLFASLGDLFLRQFACLPRLGSKQWSATADMHSSLETAPVQELLPGASDVTWTATRARNFVVVRFGADTVEMARHWLRAVFDHDGTVEREFGKRYLFCLQDH